MKNDLKKSLQEFSKRNRNSSKFNSNTFDTQMKKIEDNSRIVLKIISDKKEKRYDR